MRRTSCAVAAIRSSVPLMRARWWARARASAPAWSQEIVAVRSAISAWAPRLMTDSSSSRIGPALETSMCSGSVITAWRPVHYGHGRGGRGGPAGPRPSRSPPVGDGRGHGGTVPPGRPELAAGLAEPQRPDGGQHRDGPPGGADRQPAPGDPGRRSGRRPGRAQRDGRRSRDSPACPGPRGDRGVPEPAEAPGHRDRAGPRPGQPGPGRTRLAGRPAIQRRRIRGPDEVLPRPARARPRRGGQGHPPGARPDRRSRCRHRRAPAPDGAHRRALLLLARSDPAAAPV